MADSEWYDAPDSSKAYTDAQLKGAATGAVLAGLTNGVVKVAGGALATAVAADIPQLAKVLQAVISPPVSTTGYVNGTGRDLWLSLACTLNPSVSVTATVLAEISADGLSWTPVADLVSPVNAAAIAADQRQVVALVPKTWHFRFTATNATLDALVAIG